MMIIRATKHSLTATSLVLITACGGGGGGGTQVTGTTPTAPPLAIQATSYLNAKNLGFGQSNLPFDPYTGVAHTFSDFKRNGSNQLFIATVGYSPSDPSTYNNKGVFAFYIKQPDGSYIQDQALISNSTGCLHPRKSIVADFNQDGKPDIFVACTGLDVAPYPGEKSAFIFSNSNGTYSTSWMNFDAYTHGASAADINNDGYPDIVATDSNVSYRPFVLINNKNETFTKRTDLLPQNLLYKQMYSAELIDFNQDGKIDLWLAGHEWDDGNHNQMVPSIYLGDGTGDFSTATPIILPQVPNEGVVLDIIYYSGNLYMLRTSGGDGTFYQSTVIQKVNYQNLSSSIIYNSNRISNNGFPWNPWIILANGRIVSTSDKFNFSVSP